MKHVVLVVDDSLTVRMDIGDALAAAGLDAVLCGDIASAREALARNDCFLMVLDLVLPDGDGIEFLKEVRGTPKTATIPVLLLSTEGEVKDRVRGMHAGANEYVGKPYEVGQVVARARALVRAKEERASSAGHHVLVIDDSPTFRYELKRALEGAGYEVHEAATGEEGLAMAATVRPDAVVVDGMLPGIDGATVVRRLKSDATLRRAPCLLLTASEGADAELRSLEAGADAHARKSQDLDMIIVRLGALLRGAIAADADGGPSLFGPKRLLAVDDSPTFLDALGTELRQEGYDVVLASSGEEALELLAAQPVDCILLDLVMPAMSGEETCRRIKQRAEWRGVPLMMLTSRDDREAMIVGINAGADDYIGKASGFEVLKARLRAQLRRKHFEDENRRIREKLVRTETEARFQRLIHSNIIGIIVGHIDGQLTDANNAFLQMVGYSREELDGGAVRWNELTPVEWRDVTRRAVEQLRVTGSANPLECEFFRKDGGRLPIVLGLVKLEGIDTVVGFVLDRTEQKLAEEKLRGYADALGTAYRDLQAAQSTLVQSAKMASLGELVAGVAHEINNPLAFVTSHLKTARNSLANIEQEIHGTISVPAKAQWDRAESRLREMSVGLERIADLVVKLRTFSRLDEGEYKTVDIGDCIESVLTILRHRLSDRIEVVLRLSEPHQLACFPGLLNQALLNLVANAIDAIDGNGTVTISSEWDGPTYSILVSDTGSGISPELRDRVFEPFFTTKPVGQGTGLGLSITYSIVRKHGGSLELRDADGGGTVAIVRLPRNGPQPPP